MAVWRVTPYVGVWIETLTVGLAGEISKVTPYVGVWIETSCAGTITSPVTGHSLCGSVD